MIYGVIETKYKNFTLMAFVQSILESSKLQWYCFLSGPPSKPVGPIKILDIQRTSTTIEWQPPSDDGGSPLKAYIIEVKEQTRTTWKKVDRLPADITTYCIQNLTEKTDYLIRVFAENSVGMSEPLETENIVRIKSPYGEFWIDYLKILSTISRIASGPALS